MIESTMILPEKVTLVEVGPRDGFQFEKKIIPTELKLKIINGLIDAGIKNIQATSFVNKAVVPQMGDAEEREVLLHHRANGRPAHPVYLETGSHIVVHR